MRHPRAMAPSPKSTKSSSSKKPSKHDSDSDGERPSPSRRASSSSRKSASSSSTKKSDKKEPKPSLLKSMFTKDRSEAPALSSRHFKDESRSASKSSKLDSAMFRDESRAPVKVKSEKVKSEVRSEKYKSEKKKEVKKEKKIMEEEEEFTEEPDFSDFKSKYEMPEKEGKKPEKKPEPSAKYESRPEPSVVPKKYESKKVESKAVKSAPKFKTVFTDDRDVAMAEKQTKIAELKGEELEEQEKWALEKLKAHAGTCIAGFTWIRHVIEAAGEQKRLDGYRCAGGAHFVTHEMVAKGEGGSMGKTSSFISWQIGQRTALRLGLQPAPEFTEVRWELISESQDQAALSRNSGGLSGLGSYFHPFGGLTGGSGGLGSSPFGSSPFGNSLFGGLPGGNGGSGNNPFDNDPFGYLNNNRPPPGSPADRLQYYKGHRLGGGGGLGGTQVQPGGSSRFGGFGGFGGGGQNDL
ncbi:hypothetical protein BKA65DRAFT_520574 [Rhexocercosporidium sp. MPI-PUGE-AT-0058]|nr:hypothetical protein BKA65DRAFT_520574 [Rhexocercosporidium sp. MPI-PUGE-AT-0058]